MLLKICGTTSLHDALLAARAGADYLGIILEHERSPRSISLETAVALRDALQNEGMEPPLVAVTVNLPAERILQIQQRLQPAVFQLHGDEPPEHIHPLVGRGLRIWSTSQTHEAAREMIEAGAEAIVVDARAHATSGEMVYGGTGQTSDWSLAAALSASGVRVVLSGGLNAENVAQAMETVNPWAVDAVSSLEARPGVKDAMKLQAFSNAVRAFPT